MKKCQKTAGRRGVIFLIHTVLCDPVLAVWPSLFIWDHLLKCLFFQSVYLSCSAAGRSQPFLYTEFPLWRDMFSEFEGEMSYFRSHTRKDWSGHTTAEVWSYETFMIVLRPRSRSLFLSTCFLSSSVVRQVKHFCRNALTYRYMQLTGIWSMSFPNLCLHGGHWSGLRWCHHTFHWVIELQMALEDLRKVCLMFWSAHVVAKDQDGVPWSRQFSPQSDSSQSHGGWSQWVQVSSLHIVIHW